MALIAEVMMVICVIFGLHGHKVSIENEGRNGRHLALLGRGSIILSDFLRIIINTSLKGCYTRAVGVVPYHLDPIRPHMLVIF